MKSRLLVNPCALAGDGRVWCWGCNHDGEMGLGHLGRPRTPGDPDACRKPLVVPHLADQVALSSQAETTCTVGRNGVTRCWGPFAFHSRTVAPTVPDGLPPARDVWSGGGHQCVLSRDNRVWCWTFGSPNPMPDLAGATRLLSHGEGPHRGGNVRGRWRF